MILWALVDKPESWSSKGHESKVEQRRSRVTDSLMTGCLSKVIGHRLSENIYIKKQKLKVQYDTFNQYSKLLMNFLLKANSTFVIIICVL